MSSAQGNRTEIETRSNTNQADGTSESRTLSVRINRPFAAAYEFLVDPANWTRWAFGLGRSLRQSGGKWIADSDDGVIEVRFTPRNAFGIVDHTVVRPAGPVVYVPMRLITNGTGCELLFTLFREPSMTNERYDADANFVQRDLNGLKALLEK